MGQSAQSSNATSGDLRLSFPYRPDPASNPRIFPTSTRQTPSDSPPSILGSRRAARSCGCTGRGGWRRPPCSREFGSVHLVRGFKCARHLDAEVTQHRRARLRRVLVEKNVMSVSPQARLAANERPDLPKGRPPPTEAGSPRHAPRRAGSSRKRRLPGCPSATTH
jgi:hypothetical protein